MWVWGEWKHVGLFLVVSNFLSYVCITYLICVCSCLLNVVGGEFMEQLDFLFPRNGKQPDFSPSQTATHMRELKIFALAFKILCYLKKERV